MSASIEIGARVEVRDEEGHRLYSGELVDIEETRGGGRAWAHVRLDERSADAGAVALAALERVHRIPEPRVIEGDAVSEGDRVEVRNGDGLVLFVGELISIDGIIGYVQPDGGKGRWPAPLEHLHRSAPVAATAETRALGRTVLGRERDALSELRAEHARYRDALDHIAAGNISPAIDFARHVLDGKSVDEADSAGRHPSGSWSAWKAGHR